MLSTVILLRFCGRIFPICANGVEMDRFRFPPLLHICSSGSSRRLPFRRGSGSLLRKYTRVFCSEEAGQKPRSGFGERRSSIVFGFWPGEWNFIFINRSASASSTAYHYRKITTSSSTGNELLTKALQHFVSSENGEACCIEKMCGIYIQNLCQSSNLNASISLLTQLNERQLHPDLPTYNALLAAAAESHSFTIFSDIFQQLLLSKQPPDSTSYHNLAKSLPFSPDSSLLLAFIRAVSAITADNDPTVINRIIFFAAKCGQIDTSLMMFEELKKHECKIDTVTFNTVLVILGRAGRVDRMLSEYSSMKQLGFAPDVVTFGTLINCLRRLGRLDLCTGFAKEMVDGGFELDLEAYTALIDGLGRAGRVDDALMLFGEMKRFCRASIYVYRAMIANLRKFGRVQQSMDLVEEMKSNASKLVGAEDFRKKKRRNVGEGRA